jgi:hypothetical protein
MNCASRAQQTPPTLIIESFVQSRAGMCKVDAELSASHDIEITNWGGRSYIVDIHGECQTPYVRYRGTNGPEQTWDQDLLFVQSCPGSGRKPSRAVARQALMSLGAGRAQSLKTDLRWVVPGWPASSRTESLGAQVDTL